MNGALARAHRVALALRDPAEYVREKAWWAMSTAEGREVLSGSRLADVDCPSVGADEGPFLVINFGFDGTPHVRGLS
jgi:hypothetical protein